jgi:hypothetical protein
MLDAVFVFSYLISCLIWVPFAQAIAMWLFFCGATIGVVYFTKSNGIADAATWFSRHYLRSALVLACTLTVISSPIQDQKESAPQIALEAIVLFMWFWLFATLSTFSKSRSGD